MPVFLPFLAACLICLGMPLSAQSESTDAPPAAETTAAAPETGIKQNRSGSAAIAVKGIDFQIRADGTEDVLIALDRFARPNTLTLQGDRPRIVLDIAPVTSWSGPLKVRARGHLIKSIRTYLHTDRQTLRVVLDLGPGMNYWAEQFYYDKEKVYRIKLHKMSTAPHKP